MKRILLTLVLLCTTIAYSQEKTFESEVKRISDKIGLITQQEKDSLKIKVEKINTALDDGLISIDEATLKKQQAAKLHASNIENRVGVEERKLQQLVQDKTNGKIASEDVHEDKVSFKVFDKDITVFTIENNKPKNNRKRRNKRTTTQLLFAMGVNNVLNNHDIGSLNDSPYKFWQSHFYELGFTWKTRLSREPSATYFKYGLSFLWNNLRADDNQYHVVTGDYTNLELFPENLSESRLRHVQMTFPMHLEFDFSKNKKYDDGFIKDKTHQSVRLGFGGFVGFKLGTRQYIEYKNAEGVRVEQVQKDDFNTNVLNYGLSAYLAYKWYGLYVKYDLNPLFKNTDTRNISLGVRFDIN